MIGKLRRGARTAATSCRSSTPVEFAAAATYRSTRTRSACCSATAASPTSTTPSFSTDDPELAAALEAALPGIELAHKGGVDYVLRQATAAAAACIVANPVTAALRELGLAGTRSTHEVRPGRTTCSTRAEVRLAVLQGLLDTDGGPVTQAGRTCRIQYTTCSHRLRDDVVCLVRSLGRRRLLRGAGRPRAAARAARGRPVHHRHDAHVLDIRLPAGHRAVPARRASGGVRRDGRRPADAVHRQHRAGRARRRRVCIQVAAEDSLYVTEDFLRHAQHAQRRLHHPRRGAEHLARADEDVPHPARVRLEDGRHRRRHPGRPAGRHRSRACGSSGTSSTASTTSTSPS